MIFATALLAGGRSTRMGRDKAMLEWEGEPLWQKQWRMLAELQPTTMLLSLREDQRSALIDAPLSAPSSEELPQIQKTRRLESQFRNHCGAALWHQTSSAAFQSLQCKVSHTAEIGTPQRVLPPISELALDTQEKESAGSLNLREKISSQTNRASLVGTTQLIFDPPTANAGPLTGIIGCLHRAQLPTLVLAVDMPHMSASFLRAHLTDDPRGFVFRGSHGFEPLAALYTPAMLPALEESLSTHQLALQPLINRLVNEGHMRVIDMQPTDAKFFHNVNTPSDLEDKFAAAVQHTRLHRDGRSEHVDDVTAREEPLEIRVGDRSIAVVMRTPGHDRELAAGFLVSEGVVQHSNQIIDILKCHDGEGRSKGNIIRALLADPEINLDSLTRHVFSASSCGLCGKTSIDSVFQRFPAVEGDWQIEPSLLWTLPDKVRAAQNTFAKTGGLHACAIFDLQGNLIVLREDVGRHNALDKVLGYGLMHDLLPFDQHLLFLSGRVSFEMMQKALAAGVPLVAAISAPSSLAVDFANESNQTLIGFLRDQTMNVYAHGKRLGDQNRGRDSSQEKR